jgi:hypothetical protein
LIARGLHLARTFNPHGDPRCCYSGGGEDMLCGIMPPA